MNDDAVFIPGRGVIARVDVHQLVRHGDATKFEYHDRFGMACEGFILRFHDRLVAYENRCPHWSVPLDAEENQFLDASKSFLFCPMHGACFEADNGHCFQGPCQGDSLDRFEIALEGNIAVISTPRPRLFI